jgi:tRNA(Ile)-lysidine synthase TilS/MesJ
MNEGDNKKNGEGRLGGVPGAPLRNPREEALVRNLIQNPHMTNVELATASGFKSKTVDSKQEVVRVALKRPRVRERLEELLNEHYPSHEADFAAVVKKAVFLATHSTNLKEVTDFMDKYARLAGYQSATKSMNLNANVGAAPRLPGQDEDDQ